MHRCMEEEVCQKYCMLTNACTIEVHSEHAH